MPDRSLEAVQVVCCITSQAGKVVAQARVCLRQAKPPDQVLTGNPTPPADGNWHELGRWAPVHGDDQGLPLLNAADYSSGVVAKVTRSNVFLHPLDGRPGDGDKALEEMVAAGAKLAKTG